LSEATPEPRRRDEGLDAFRGLTVILMILVNLQGDASQAFPLLAHAAWDGLTLADLVFPWFILAVGLSAGLASGSTTVPPLSVVLRRTALLVLIGVVLGWLIRPTLDLAEIRWTGVLQRIALVYLACMLVARRSSGPGAPAILALVCLLVHSLGLLTVTAPGETSPSLAMGEGVSAWLDQSLLPGHLHREQWDPEGVWSTLSAIATGLLGVAFARFRLGRPGRPLIVASLIALLLGCLLIPLLPLNKALWTASYALVAAGAGGLLLAALRAVAAGSHRDRVLGLLLLAGQTALTAYVLHMLLIAVLVRRPFGDTLWLQGFDALQRLGLGGQTASLVFALLATALTLAPLPWLRRRGWLIRA
jgi:predicted acyltransferase